MLEVDSQSALVAVQAEKDRILDFDIEGLVAREISGVHAFDLDDVCAEVTQHLRAHRPHLDLCEVEDAHAVQWQRRHRPLHTGLRFSTNARGPSSVSSAAIQRSM